MRKPDPSTDKSKVNERPRGLWEQLRMVLISFVVTVGVGIPSVANAQSYGIDEGSFFEIPPGDRSSELMMTMFGDSWRTITNTTSVPYSSHSASGLSHDSAEGGIIGSMSRVLNVACLVLTLFVVFMSTVTGIMISAHKGTPFGEKYSTLWMPLRSMLSLVLLAPIFGGYSLIQGGVFYVSKVSIGIANMAFASVLGFMNAGYSITTPQVGYGTDIAKALLRSNACEQFMNRVASDDVPAFTRIVAPTSEAVEISSIAAGPSTRIFDLSGVGAYSSGYTGTSIKTLTWAMSFDGTAASGMPKSVCGVYSYTVDVETAPIGRDATIAAARRQYGNDVWRAFMVLNNDMKSLAAVLGNPDYAGESVSRRHMYDASLNYQNAIRNAAALYQSQIDTITSDGALVGEVKNHMASAGWLMFGSYYWTLQRAQSTSADIFSSRPSVSATAQDCILSSPCSLADVDLALDYKQTAGFRVSTYLNDYAFTSLNELPPDDDVISSAMQARDEDSLDWLSARISKPIVNTVISKMTDNNGDAIGNFTSIGHFLVGISETYFATQSLLNIFSNTAVGKVASRVGDAVSNTYDTVTGNPSGEGSGLTFLNGIFALIFVAGAFLAYWLPSIPMILWVAGITGWLISVFLSAVSAPIWAAGHSAPEGDGWVSQYAKSGYMIMLTLLLRPTMMVFGMVGGMVIMQAVGLLLSGFLPIAFSSLNSGSVQGLTTIMAFIAISAVIVISTANRCFELCFETGDQILKFLGGGIDSLGDTKVLNSSGQAYENILRSIGGLKRNRLPGRRGTQGGGSEKLSLSKKQDL